MNNKRSNEVVLFLMSNAFSDVEIMKTSPYAKVFLAATKYMGAHALITHYNTHDIQDTEHISYLRINKSLQSKLLVAPIVEIVKSVIWIKRHKPSLVIMSGAPIKQNVRFLYRLMLPKQKFALIMATPSVDKNRLLRLFTNKLLQINILFFSTLIADKYWRHDRLRLPLNKIKIVDPAFHDFGFASKDFSVLRLVYVGVLSGRGVENTIEGLALFLRKNPKVKVTYDIFGRAKKHEIESLRAVINKFSIDSVVKLHGFLTQEEAAELIQTCNIGIAYLPNTSYYGNSSAKTLEYLIAGLPVLATPSPFKTDFINDSTGVMHDDNPQAFAKGLELMYARRFDYKPEEIRKKHLKYTMDEIVRTQYVPLFRQLIRDKR